MCGDWPAKVPRGRHRFQALEPNVGPALILGVRGCIFNDTDPTAASETECTRDPKDDKNTRILQTMVSGIHLSRSLEPGCRILLYLFYIPYIMHHIPYTLHHMLSLSLYIYIHHTKMWFSRPPCLRSKPWTPSMDRPQIWNPYIPIIYHVARPILQTPPKQGRYR